MQPGDRLIFQGGLYSDYMDFEQLSLEIEPMSMGRTSEGMMQRRAMELFQITMQLLQIAPQVAQYSDLEPLLNLLGDTFNWPQFSKILNLKNLQAAAQGQPPVGPQVSPLLGTLTQGLQVQSKPSMPESKLQGRLNGAGLVGKEQGSLLGSLQG
jgi:hypothetical protein